MLSMYHMLHEAVFILSRPSTSAIYATHLHLQNSSYSSELIAENQQLGLYMYAEHKFAAQSLLVSQTLSFVGTGCLRMHY